MKETSADKTRRWRATNRERALESGRKNAALYRERHPEKIRQFSAKRNSAEDMRKWRAANADRAREIGRKNSALYRERNPDKVRNRLADNYSKNRETRIDYAKRKRSESGDDLRTAARASYAANPSSRIESSARWAKNNPDKKAEIDARRRAAKLSAAPPWLTSEHKRQMTVMYAKARSMTAVGPMVYHVDHIYPLQGHHSCGLHVPWNLQILERAKNIRKRNTEPAWGASTS